MAGVKQFKDPVQIPIKIERNLKNAITEHCKKEGLMFSGLIRKLLSDYAEKEGLIEAK